MPKLDEAKENLAMLKLWIGIVIGVFTAIVGWTLNKFKIDENILIILALLVLIILLITFAFCVRKINKIIKEIGEMPKE
ncbi:MAG: hypothetical protein SOW25_02180 [Helicobacter sp.]|nr:hypothetical protein [Helicobacteraceae bacterium]MDY3113118.1 hypothetical protein [Helicobacter sp.]